MPKNSTCERPSSHKLTPESTAEIALLILEEEPHSKFAVVASEAATVFAERKPGGIETRILLRAQPVGTRTTQ